MILLKTLVEYKYGRRSIRPRKTTYNFQFISSWKKSVLDAFSNLSLTINPDGAKSEAEQEKNTLDQTNPYVSTYFIKMLEEFHSKEEADEIFWGILVCHQALRREAKLRGGVLPTFTDEFVQNYAKKREDSINAISIERKITRQKAAIQLYRQGLVEFENWEQEFSSIVGREEAVVQSRWGREQDLRYLGMINLYLLFRIGCKDPKNFQQKTS